MEKSETSDLIVCPLRWRIEGERHCLRERCAWWIQGDSACAVVSISCQSSQTRIAKEADNGTKMPT